MEYYAGDRLIGGLEPCEENLARIEELLDDNGLHLDINGFVVPEDESAWDDETEIPRELPACSPGNQIARSSGQHMG